MLHPRFSAVISLFITFFAVVNLHAQTTEMTSKMIEKDGRKLLYGKMSSAQLQFDFPIWKQNMLGYSPDSATIAALKKQLTSEVEVLVFLGTWCGDSRREVPRFLRVAETCAFPEKNFTLYGTDIFKKMEGPLIETYQVKRVPTFVVLKKGKEIGRITEYAEKSVEADLLAILETKKD